MPSHRTPRADAALVALLRADLSAAPFTVDAVAETLGPIASAALEREQTLPARRVTSTAGSPTATLVRLFTLGDAVDTAEAARALPTLGVGGALAMGLVVQEGDAVVATCDLRPYAADDSSWWVASDLSEVATRRPLHGDHVLGIGGASMTLAAWTPRPEVARALDVGTGCGVQALHLSAHAESVVVTDLSERALEFARFNAELNGLDWELRRGSMLEPVAGEEFDLVVSNPPFVITPRVASMPMFEYRDGGRAGDTVVSDLVRSVGEVLAPGGISQFLGNWEIPAGSTWGDRVRSWVEGTGLDAWIVQREVQDPAQYAETWARDGGHHSATAEFMQMYEAWLDDFAARDVEAIGFGMITLQRPATEREPFIDLVDVPHIVAQPMGPHVLAGLRARTWLAEHSDDEVLDVAWRCADDVTEARHGLPGADDPSVIEIRQGGGLRRVQRVETATAAYLSVADGSLTARAATEAIAQLLEVDVEQVRAEVVPVVRSLVADGLLL
ncbi:DUF7059 domain-containing protein [Actinomycetota bacterium]